MIICFFQRTENESSTSKDGQLWLHCEAACGGISSVHSSSPSLANNFSFLHLLHHYKHFSQLHMYVD